jgi:hypothetical protein
MMPHLKIQTLLGEYFTWQPICHNRLYSVIKVPQLAQLPDFTSRAICRLNERKDSTPAFNPQRLSPYIPIPKGRGFTAFFGKI